LGGALLCGGNTNELGDVSGSPGKSCLFFFTAQKHDQSAIDPGIRLAGEGVDGLEKQCALALSGALSMILENPRERGALHAKPYSSPHQVSKVNSL